MNSDLDLWRTFVAAAEELSFARAAERVHLDPSGASRHIRQLEDRLGVRLFDRTTRSVQLTPEGSDLLEHARSLTSAADRLDALARQAARSQGGTLEVGCTAHAAGGELLGLLTGISARHGLTITTREVDLTDATGGVRDGHADVGIVFAPFDTTDLDIAELASVPRVAVLPVHHRLAGRRSIEIGEILGETWVAPECSDPLFVDFWLCTEHRNGIEPVISERCRTPQAALFAVMAGRAVSVGATVHTDFRVDGVSLVPVADIEPARVVAVWRRNSTNRDIRLVVDALTGHVPLAANH